MKYLYITVVLFVFQHSFCQIIEAESTLFQNYKLSPNEIFVDVFESKGIYFYHSIIRQDDFKNQIFNTTSYLIDSNGIKYELKVNESPINVKNNKLYTVYSRKNSVNQYDITQIYTVYEFDVENKSKLNKIATLEIGGFPYVRFLENGNLIINGGGCVEGCSYYGFSTLYSFDFNVIYNFFKAKNKLGTVFNYFDKDFIISSIQIENESITRLEVYDIKLNKVINTKILDETNLKFSSALGQTDNELLFLHYNFDKKKREIIILDKISLNTIKILTSEVRITNNKMIYLNSKLYFSDNFDIYCYNSKLEKEKWKFKMRFLKTFGNRFEKSRHTILYSLSENHLLIEEYDYKSQIYNHKNVTLSILNLEKRELTQQLAVNEIFSGWYNNLKLKILGDYIFIYSDNKVKNFKINLP